MKGKRAASAVYRLISNYNQPSVLNPPTKSGSNPENFLLVHANQRVGTLYRRHTFLKEKSRLEAPTRGAGKLEGCAQLGLYYTCVRLPMEVLS